uniref:Uncharacterized protein n=1 Tax=Neogobius melanostomus TaxID=47308 RepID=A0A8C6TCB0_9GOBI
MTAVVGRAWGWVRSWGASRVLNPILAEDGCLGYGLGGHVRATRAAAPWRNSGRPRTRFNPRKWRSSKQGSKRLKLSPDGGISLNGQECDVYGTPPPSPTPPVASPFRLFVSSWNLEIVPEHYDIGFNFLRHLFDLFVVGFLWTVSTPCKIVLEILGVQGALRLWFHGMAMFIVSTVGMAGLLGLIREYLPQFTLVYGIIQAVVISVSVKQSVILGGVEEEQEDELKEKVEKAFIPL